MFATRSLRRSLFMLALIASPALFVACDDDDPAEPDPEPTFNRVEFTLMSGNTTRVDTVTTTGTQTGNRNFPAGTTTVTVSARFLRADGTVDPVVTAADFELRGGTAGTSTGVTFALTAGQSFQGTISGLTNGARTIRMLLWHKGDNHEDFSQILTLQIGP